MTPDDEYIKVFVDNGRDNPDEIRFSEIWCGLVWPNQPVHPAYFCMFGEDYRGDKRGKLIFIHEEDHRGINLYDFFQKLSDATTLMLCKKVYVDMDNEPYCDELRSFIYDNNVSLSLGHSPFVNNFSIGITKIDELGRNQMLELKEGTTLHQEMKTLNINEYSKQKDDETESRIYPIHALRYIVCAYKKYSSKVGSDVKAAQAAAKKRILW